MDGVWVRRWNGEVGASPAPLSEVITAIFGGSVGKHPPLPSMQTVVEKTMHPLKTGILVQGGDFRLAGPIQ